MAITMLAGYLVIINAAALLMMADDKRRAKRHQWRAVSYTHLTLPTNREV